MALGFSELEDNIITEHPEAHAALVIMEARREQTRALAVLGPHSATVPPLRKTLKQLHDTQKERRATVASQLSEAASLFQMHKNKELPYQPSDDGFVFSNTEITAFIHRRDRLKAATA